MSPLGALVTGFLVIAAVVAIVVLRIAWAKRNDPADVDLSSMEQWERAREALRSKGGQS